MFIKGKSLRVFLLVHFSRVERKILSPDTFVHVFKDLENNKSVHAVVKIAAKLQNQLIGHQLKVNNK